MDRVGVWGWWVLVGILVRVLEFSRFWEGVEFLSCNETL